MTSITRSPSDEFYFSVSQSHGSESEAAVGSGPAAVRGQDRHRTALNSLRLPCMYEDNGKDEPIRQENPLQQCVSERRPNLQEAHKPGNHE